MIILVYLENRPLLVVILLIATNLGFVCYIGHVDPHTQPSLRNIEIMNEALLQIVTYHLVTTWCQTDRDFEMMLGWSLIGSIVFLYSFNLGYIAA